MLTKPAVTDDRIAALLAPLGTVRQVRPLPGGLFASVLRADLDDGRAVVVKVTGADTSRLLRYEHGVLGTEAAVHRLGHAAGLPMPQVLHLDTSRTVLDGDALVVTFLDGALWSTLDLDAAAAVRARRSLGGVMARLHRLTGERFGYPAPQSGLLADNWPDAFSAMIEAALADARRWDVDLPAESVRAAVARHRDALATVTTPRLVHADLWPGNLLLDPVTHDVVGVIDAERAMWGDPLFDLVGADQLGAGAVPTELLNGYREAGGDLHLGDGEPGSGDPGAWTRLQIYRAYFACLLVIEITPRAYTGDWVAAYERAARANLERVLADLNRPSPDARSR